MHSHNNSTRAHHGKRTASQVGLTLWSMLLLLLCTSAVFAQPTASNPPSNLQAIPFSNTQIDLSFLDNSGDETHFEIERKTGSGGTYAVIVTLATTSSAGTGGTENFSDTGLSPSTQYFYRVRAKIDNPDPTPDVYSPYSTEVSATTLPDPPAPPSGLFVNAISDVQINLNWADNSSTETAFIIWRKTGIAGTYAPVDSVGANVTSYSDMSLTPSTEYYYKVRAKNVSGNSAYSNEAAATTFPPVPDDPSGLMLTNITSSSMKLQWTDNSEDETKFRVYISTAPGPFPTGFTLIDSVAGSSPASSNGTFPATPHTVGGLISGVTYTFAVTAVNGTGYSDAAINSATTTPTAPVAPSSLIIDPFAIPPNPAATTVQIKWTDNSNNETSWKIERKLSSASSYTQIANPGTSNQIGTGGTEIFFDTGLLSGTTYNYRVRAFNAGGNSGFSNVLTVTTLATPPTAPSSLTATAVSSSQINLSWTDNATNETRFRILRSLSVSGPFTQIDSVNANVTSYSNTGLASTTQYFYRVVATNSGAIGNTAVSNTAFATTFPPPPLAPTNVTATPISGDSILVTWTDVSNEAGYIIERQIGGSGPFTPIDTLGLNVTSFGDNGLNGATQYCYRLRAFNVTDLSPYSAIACATTLPDGPNAAPSNFMAVAANNSVINLSWANNSTNNDGFKIESSLSPSGPFSPLVTINNPNATTYSNTGLSANTTYYYRMYAYNTGGNSGLATVPLFPPPAPGMENIAFDNTFPNPPANAPTNLQIVGPTPFSDLPFGGLLGRYITLSWTDNSSDETKFYIERKIGPSGTYVVVDSVLSPLPPNSFGVPVPATNDSLSGSTEYYYRVRAANDGGSSGYSNEVNAITGPATPTNLFATAISNTQINLLWTDVATNEMGYVVERNGSPLLAANPLPANTTSFSDMTATSSTLYTYRVYATNNILGHSAFSNNAQVTTPPAQPGPTLVLTTIGGSSIKLDWLDNSTDELGFGIERKVGPSGTFVKLDSVLAPLPVPPGDAPDTFTDIGLIPGTQYFYRVFAFNANGNSIFSNEANITIPQVAPNAPSMLTAAPSGTSVTLNWQDNSNNEDGFSIERKIGIAGTYAVHTTVAAGSTAYINSGLSTNTQYFYRVRAFNSGGSSAYTNEASATIDPDLPEAPSGLTATAISNTQINLTWVDNANNETGFKVERKTGTGAYVEIASNVNPGSGTGTIISFPSSGLTGFTVYTYRVRAFNVDGHSGYTSEVGDTTLVDPPGVPSGLSAIAISSNQVNLSFTDNAINEDGFKIERKTGSGAYAEIGSRGPSSANPTTFTDNTVNGNTAYTYRVRSFNINWTSPPSNEASVTTPVPSIATPTNLMASAVSSTQINLSWTDNATNETGYKVERKIGAAGTYTEIADITTADANSYQNNGLTPSTEYFYRVRAYNASNNSSYSNEASATTPGGGLLAPSGLAATAVSKTQIDLSWTDNATGETGFLIERKIGTGGSYSQVGTASANATSFQHTGLNANTLYTYRVRATDGSNNSPYSNEDGTKTWLNGPTNLVATASGTTINLAWVESIVNETSFVVERKTGAAGSYTTITSSLPQNSTSYSDVGLAANTQYFYRVYGANNANRSEYSNEDDATTGTSGPVPPIAPSNLTATAVSKNQINLAWQDNSSDETNFLIERKTGSAGAYSQIGSVGANVTTFNNTGLGVNTLYFYRVRATNANGNSAYSNEDDERTWMNGPTNLVASNLNSTQIGLTWSEAIVNETGFIVERKTGAAGTYAQVGPTLPQNSTSYTDNVANTSTTYFYRVHGVNSVNRSEYSNEDDNSGAPAPVNLALNKPITASSTFSNSTPTRGNDGNNVSFWRSGGVSTGNPIAWLRVELGATPVTVARVEIVWNQFYHATQYEIQVSNDGTNWTIVNTNNAATNATQDVSFTPVSARYVRAYLKMPNTGSYRLVEFRAYATGTISKRSEQAAAENAVIPEDITLEQNYPNPFNPSTTIAFSLPAGAHVSLKVINVTGQEVATLVDGYRDRGNHRVTFKGAKLPSGVYYAVLKAGEVTQIKRMTLAK